MQLVRPYYANFMKEQQRGE